MDAAGALEASAAAAGLEASFERRKEGWEHQIELAKRDVGALEKQLEAARLRHEIAVRSLEIHDASIEQLEELHAFYGDKFTDLGLYTFLASTLQRIYREAYNSAYGMARLAEQAYRFERDDDTSELLAPSYWDASRAGLLAGERLLVDLQNMERRFLETNYRCLEIDQAFSLTQVDPAALVRLRETGNCEFVIPEVFFDLFYPGHYRRRDQVGAAHDPVRHRAVHERERDADPARQQHPQRAADRSRRARAVAAATQRLHRNEHGAAGRRRLRAELPRRALYAVRGRRDASAAGASRCRGRFARSTTGRSTT